MRLINADALMAEMHNVILEDGEDRRTFYEVIERQSTIEERKKGKWIRNFDGNEWYWFCSNCKGEWYEEDLLMGGNDFPNFCPNCGADMRGEHDG